MALDLEIIVKERESGVIVERFVQLSLTPKELGVVNFAMHSIEMGTDVSALMSMNMARIIEQPGGGAFCYANVINFVMIRLANVGGIV